MLGESRHGRKILVVELPNKTHGSLQAPSTISTRAQITVDEVIRNAIADSRTRAHGTRHPSHLDTQDVTHSMPYPTDDQRRSRACMWIKQNPSSAKCQGRQEQHAQESHLLVGKPALALHELLTLLRCGVKEARLHLGLLVLEGHVAREDVATDQQGPEIPKSASMGQERKSMGISGRAFALILTPHSTPDPTSSQSDTCAAPTVTVQVFPGTWAQRCRERCGFTRREKRIVPCSPAEP